MKDQTAPAGEMPPLPKPAGYRQQVSGMYKTGRSEAVYTTEQMQAYAQAAFEAGRQQGMREEYTRWALVKDEFAKEARSLGPDAQRWAFVRKHWSAVQFRLNRDQSLKAMVLTVKPANQAAHANEIEREIDAAIAAGEKQ